MPDTFPLHLYPWDEWFWYTLDRNLLDGFPLADYEFYKISPTEDHLAQLAIRSPIDHPSFNNRPAVKAHVIYILTLNNDTPNWGGINQYAFSASPACGNWKTSVYENPGETTRSQTWALNAAIAGNPENAAKIVAAIAKEFSLDCGITATVWGNPELDAMIRVAILGNPERTYSIRAAILTERSLETSIIAAVGKDFSLSAGMLAAIQGNPEQNCHLKAAIKGEAEKSVGIVAYVVKTRVNSILLEMENLWPQELDLRSTPNWASKVKDYRKSSLSARDS